MAMATKMRVLSVVARLQIEDYLRCCRCPLFPLLVRLDKKLFRIFVVALLTAAIFDSQSVSRIEATKAMAQGIIVSPEYLRL